MDCWLVLGHPSSEGMLLLLIKEPDRFFESRFCVVHHVVVGEREDVEQVQRRMGCRLGLQVYRVVWGLLVYPIRGDSRSPTARSLPSSTRDTLPERRVGGWQDRLSATDLCFRKRVRLGREAAVPPPVGQGLPQMHLPGAHQPGNLRKESSHQIGPCVAA